MLVAAVDVGLKEKAGAEGLDLSSEVLVAPPNEKLGAGAEATEDVAVVVAGLSVLVDNPNEKAGEAADAVVVGFNLSLEMPAPNDGNGRDDDADVDMATAESFETISKGLSVRLNVTVDVLLELGVLFVAAVDGGDEIVPIENGVDVVDVTDDNAADPLSLDVSFSLVTGVTPNDTLAGLLAS